MQSFWVKNSVEKADILIIGAGFTGLNTAIELKLLRPNLNVLIVDNELGYYAASQRNAGFACFGSPGEILADIEKFGVDPIRELVNLRKSGISKIKQQFAQSIDSQFNDGFEVFRQHDLESFHKIELSLDALNEISGNVFERIENQSIPVKGIYGAFRIKGEFSLNPFLLWKCLFQKATSLGVDFLNDEIIEFEELSKGVRLFSKSQIYISTVKLIIASNGFSNKYFSFLKIVPARAQVLITEPIINLKLKGNFHMDEGYYYFRNVGNRVLLGGGRNLDFNGETTDELGLNLPIQIELEKILGEMILPDTRFKIEHRWTGIMGFGESKIPRIQSFGDNVCSLVGLGGMGVAISFSLTEKMAQMVVSDFD